MHSTYDTQYLASVTELRTDTTGLLDYVNEASEAVLIQRNNVPCGILMGLEQYAEYLALKKQGSTDHTGSPNPESADQE